MRSLCAGPSPASRGLHLAGLVAWDAMTTDIKTLTTSEAAARVGLSHQYMRVLLGQGKGPKGTREGKGRRGGGYRFTPEAIDAWDAARVKRAPKGSKKRMGEQYAAATTLDPAKLERLEAAGWKAGERGGLPEHGRRGGC